MTETGQPIYLSMKRLILIILAIAISLQLFGCTVGYITFKVNEPNAAQPDQILSNVKISYNIEESANDSTLSSVIRKTLQYNFNIQDIQSLNETNPTNNQGRFIIICAQRYFILSLPGAIWTVISLASLSTIPAIIDQNSIVTFKLIAPGGDEKFFQYGYIERSYNWLPFILFKPGYYKGPLPHMRFDHYEKERQKMLEEVTTQFMIEAVPFILSHTTLTTS